MRRGVTPADALIWHRLNGVFWGAFLLFSITTASIISGSIIERAAQAHSGSSPC